MKISWLFSTLVSLGEASYLLGIPTVPFTPSSESTFDLSRLHAIVVDVRHASARDEDGLTTIPPSLMEFAETFREDLAGIGIHSAVVLGKEAIDGSLFLTLDQDASQFRNAAGKTTSEGYELSVSSNGVVISGASPLGAWWGTRTVMQQAVLNDKKIKHGKGVDAPGWPERGMMLDVGRHYYPADFLGEICSYLSFFKQNVFHLHLSDHVWDPNYLNSHERAETLYAAFRPALDDPAVASLPRPVNETYSSSVLDGLQEKCARRGVTILPELESPGHSVATTDWRPELALADFSMLNLSYPGTLPAVKAYWKAAIGNFHSKIVHIGADEYDADFVDEYTAFVNDMSDYIREISGKAIRIWGTFAPVANATNVDTAVTVQQWDVSQDNGLFDFIKNGYTLVNSDDYFYLDVKYSDGGVYPKQLETKRVFHGAPDGGAYAPNILDHTNATNNPPRDSPHILGQLAVVWNDWGPNASTYHEAYYMFRDGLPALADKQWGGALTEGHYASLFAALQPAVPGQNLDLRIPSRGPTILEYDFAAAGSERGYAGGVVHDRSGNGYDGHLVGGAQIRDSALQLDGRGGHLLTPLTSKGRNYTLSFSVMPSAHGGALFSGPDSALLNGNGTSRKLIMLSGDQAYPVNITLPTAEWSDVTVEGVGAQTFISVGGGGGYGAAAAVRREEVTILMGVWAEYMQLAPMAIAAPVQKIGEGFSGRIKNVKLSSEVGQ